MIGSVHEITYPVVKRDIMGLFMSMEDLNISFIAMI